MESKVRELKPQAVTFTLKQWGPELWNVNWVGEVPAQFGEFHWRHHKVGDQVHLMSEKSWVATKPPPPYSKDADILEGIQLLRDIRSKFDLDEGLTTRLLEYTERYPKKGEGKPDPSGLWELSFEDEGCLIDPGFSRRFLVKSSTGDTLFNLADPELASKLCKYHNASFVTTQGDVHSSLYKSLQDFLIPEEECNSVDFDTIYGRKSAVELAIEIGKRLSALEESKKGNDYTPYQVYDHLASKWMDATKEQYDGRNEKYRRLKSKDDPGFDSSDREKLLYAARVLRGIADLGHKRPLGDLWSEAVQGVGAIKRVLEIDDVDCQRLGLQAAPIDDPEPAANVEALNAEVIQSRLKVEELSNSILRMKELLNKEFGPIGEVVKPEKKLIGYSLNGGPILHHELWADTPSNQKLLDSGLIKKVYSD